MTSTLRHVVRVPTLKARVADDWDLLCLKLGFSDSRTRAHIEALVRDDARQNGLDENEHLDISWSHARNLVDNCKQEWVEDGSFDLLTGMFN